MVEESNGSDEVEKSDETKMSEEILALVDEFQQAWPLEGFGGTLEMKGRRLDLQGIRVLKRGPQDGVAKSSCYGDCRSEDDEATEWVRICRLSAEKAQAAKPQSPHYKASIMPCTCNASTGEAKTETCGFLASHTSLVRNSNPTRGVEGKMTAPKDSWKLSSGLHTHAYQYVQKHT